MILDGILPVNKPIDITSYDVIRSFKRHAGSAQKIGHAGTLDPFATGVLILLLGKATKRFDEIQKWPKTYIATSMLGAASDSLDRTGVMKEQKEKIQPTREEIEIIMDQYVGEKEQVVPSYSAAKYKGKPRYKYARKGESVPTKSKKVLVHSIEVLEYKYPKVKYAIECSSGTYIRQLGWDMFRELEIDSYLGGLERSAIGEIDVTKCVSVEEIEGGSWEKALIAE